jgi:hypothetical protein
MDGYAASDSDGRPQFQSLSFAWEKETSDDIAFACLNPSPPFAIRRRPTRRQSATTISSFVLGLVAFVFAAPANVFFRSAFRFDQFAARSHQN